MSASVSTPPVPASGMKRSRKTAGSTIARASGKLKKSKVGTAGQTNWQALAAQLGASTVTKAKPTSKPKTAPASPPPAEFDAKLAPVLPGCMPGVQLTQVLAMDCEMVGVGPKQKSALAQVCVVNYLKQVVYCKYVKPKEKVTDYRTWVSGVTPAALRYADSFDTVIEEVAALFKGRTIVGHAIHNDFKALMLNHPAKLIRDTAKYPPYQRRTACGTCRPQKLKTLMKNVLSKEIQTGEHDPAEDAIAALELYQAARTEWEAALRTNTLAELKPAMTSGGPRKSAFAQRSAARKARLDGASTAEPSAPGVLAAATSTSVQVTEVSVPAGGAGSSTTPTPMPTQATRKPTTKPTSGPARSKPRTIKVMRRVDVQQAAMAFMAR